MITSMIPNVENVFKNHHITNLTFFSAYNPLINYDWSTTTTSGLRYLKDVGSTPTYNASMYFGRGAYFNGVDQGIDIVDTSRPSINSRTFSISVNIVTNSLGINYLNFMGTIDVSLRSNNSNSIRWSAYSGTQHSIIYPNDMITGVFTLTFDGTTYKAYHNSILIASLKGNVPNDGTNAFCIGGRSQISSYRQARQKDMFIFNRVLTQAEITQAYEQPEAFYTMAQADSTCVLNMPMCETSSTFRNYKTGIDYPISNYTTSVRDNAKNLQYGLQTCKFVRDSSGVIQSASNYLECDGVGYVIIPSHTDTVNIKMAVNPTSLNGNLLSGGVTKTLTGLTLNIDNNVVISNVTPTGAITLASGFSGTIKSYKEELV